VLRVIVENPPTEEQKEEMLKRVEIFFGGVTEDEK